MMAEPVDILIVDDRPDKLMALEAILSPLNENLVTAKSGAQALKLLLNREFAVLILDVQMPDIDGFETAELIRLNDRTKDLPIIFVSAFDATDENLRRVYALGAIDYIPTPSTAEAIRAKVAVLVELHRKNRTLQRLVAQMDQKTKQLDEFCYTVAHDLRAPLRAINGFSEVLLRDYGPVLGLEGGDYLGRIAESSQRLDRLILDLLSYSRLAQMDLSLDEVNLESAVQTAIKDLDWQIKEKRAKVTIRNSLPSVRSNRGALEHVFLNLLGNALKFSRNGSEPRVEIYAEEREGSVRVCVEDNGIGIRPEHHQRIFGMFEKLSDAVDNQGTGVGLAIVSKTMERLGGTRGVESNPNLGSRFWIELPKDRGAEEPRSGEFGVRNISTLPQPFAQNGEGKNPRTQAFNNEREGPV